MAFLAGILLRPAIQYGLTEAGIEAVELLAHPANNWSGETLSNENPYTFSDRQMIAKIQAHNHTVGRVTLGVILITLTIIGLRWVVLVERRSS